MPNPTDPQEMIVRQLEMLRLMQSDPEQFPEMSDQPISDADIRENLGGVATDMPEKEIRDFMLRQAGELEPIKPYRMEGGGAVATGDVPGFRMGSPEAEARSRGAYKFDKSPNLQDSPDIETLDRLLKESNESDLRGRFQSGGSTIPLGLWGPRPPEYGPGNPSGSYLDPNKGDLLMPRLSPGIRMREGQYNQSRDEVMKSLKQQLDDLQGY